MGGAAAFFGTTSVFAAVGFLVHYKLKRSKLPPPTERLQRIWMITAIVCAWLIWAIVYLAQWKPLVNPVISTK